MKRINDEYAYSIRKLVTVRYQGKIPVLWKRKNNKWVEMGVYHSVPKEVMTEFYRVEKELEGRV